MFLSRILAKCLKRCGLNFRLQSISKMKHRVRRTRAAFSPGKFYERTPGLEVLTKNFCVRIRRELTASCQIFGTYPKPSGFEKPLTDLVDLLNCLGFSLENLVMKVYLYRKGFTVT